jgi:thymidine kinase
MGTLDIIMGPMFSGKTELLIKKYNTCKEQLDEEKIIAFNYYKDTRYGDNKIISHNSNQIPSINIETLLEIFEDDDFSKRTHIFINEAQFFPDLKKNIIKLVEEYNKNVVICGLDSDFKREKFGDMWDLIPYSDCLVKLKGTCNDCSMPSLFTFRITNEKGQEVIGVENYIPLCRKCYNLR